MTRFTNILKSDTLKSQEKLKHDDEKFLSIGLRSILMEFPILMIN